MGLHLHSYVRNDGQRETHVDSTIEGDLSFVGTTIPDFDMNIVG